MIETIGLTIYFGCMIITVVAILVIVVYSLINND